MRELFALCSSINDVRLNDTQMQLENPTAETHHAQKQQKTYMVQARHPFTDYHTRGSITTPATRNTQPQPRLGTAQHNTVRHHTTQHNTTTRPGKTCHNKATHGSHGTPPHNATQRDATQHGTALPDKACHGMK